jgi:hypothetical protein
MLHGYLRAPNAVLLCAPSPDVPKADTTRVLKAATYVSGFYTLTPKKNQIAFSIAWIQIALKAGHHTMPIVHVLW